MSVSRKVDGKVTTELSSLLCVALTLVLMLACFAQLLEFDREADKAAITGLPPSAAGPMPGADLPGSRSAAPIDRTDIGGTSATGQVTQVFVRVEQGVYLAWDRTPEFLRRKAEVYADVRFPEALANGAESTLAYIGRGVDDLKQGDIAEVRFAHRAVAAVGAASAFPVREVTRMTELVARKGTPMARDIERRILARTQGNSNERIAAALQTRIAETPMIPGITTPR